MEEIRELLIPKQHKLCVTLISALLLLLATTILGAPLPEVKVISSTTIDFGTYPVKDAKKVTVRIRNIGDAPLLIKRIRQSCNCTDSKIMKKKLRPGETGSIEVAFRPYSIFEKFRKRLFVETNDPKKRFITLIIKGNPISLVNVRPDRKFYPRYMPINKTYEQLFSLLTTQKGVVFGKPNVTSNYKTELTKLAEKKISTGKMLHYAIKVTPDHCGPDLNCKVTIPITEPKGWQPVEVTVKCRIGLRLYPFPQLLTFKKSVTAPVSKQFKLRLLGDSNVKLAATLLNKPSMPGISYKFGEYKKISLPVTATFDDSFLKQLALKKVIYLNFSYPGTNSIKIKCQLDSSN